MKQVNILLADDDIDDCQFFKRAINEISLPTKLVVVNDGEELINHLCTVNSPLPDVIFLDINMPRKNGKECLIEIKGTKKFRSIPVVIFSTASNRKNIKQFFEIGADIYIHKPSDFSQFKQVIYHALPLSTENTYSKESIKHILNA